MYTVALSVSNNYGSHSASKHITVLAPCAPPSANFSWSPATPLVGKWAQFTDQSSGAPTAWAWNFGDGTGSTVKNPTHVFTAKGTYNVTLTATNACGSNSATKPVTVKPPIVP